MLWDLFFLAWWNLRFVSAKDVQARDGAGELSNGIHWVFRLAVVGWMWFSYRCAFIALLNEAQIENSDFSSLLHSLVQG
jgi:hypothetical protein